MERICLKLRTGNGPMANILVINQGSSSLKVSLFEVKEKKLVFKLSLNVKDPLEDVLKEFVSLNVIGIGHRVVHGGDKYVKATLLTSSVIKDIERFSELAPLHNPACLRCIKITKEMFKRVPQVALFDTAFFSSLPQVASTYALPFKMSLKHHIRRYGFHGIAHESLTALYRNFTKNRSAKIITMQLGGGCSMSAIDKGAPIDTSMGFTPLQGLVMETRSGDIDPGLLEYLCMKEKKSISAITKILNQHSGLLGLSGKVASMQELLTYKRDPQVDLALDLFCYTIVKYIGAYIAALKGVDALIFSGGIGENAYQIRERIIKGMQWYGLSLDSKNNRETHSLHPSEVRNISKSSSKVEVFVMGSYENEWIAKQLLGVDEV